MATTTATKISLKLLVDNNSNKVLFAEAGNDFVDFLFGLLELPLGSILSLLAMNGMIMPGSLGRLYKSVQKLDDNYLQQGHLTKNSLLEPIIAPSNSYNSVLLPKSSLKQQQPSLSPYRNRKPYRSSFSVAAPSNTEVVQGYVQGVVTYMVMDDLVVKPMSTISSLTLLNTLGVKDVGSLGDITVQVDIKKGLELVKASFESTTVLSDVFLP